MRAPGGWPSLVTSDGDPTALGPGDWSQTRSCTNTFHTDRSPSGPRCPFPSGIQLGVGPRGRTVTVSRCRAPQTVTAAAMPPPPAVCRAPMSPRLHRHWLPPVPVATGDVLCSLALWNHTRTISGSRPGLCDPASCPRDGTEYPILRDRFLWSQSLLQLSSVLPEMVLSPRVPSES